MPFLCLIAISKATPSYKNHLTLPLFPIDTLPYITTYTEYHVNIFWSCSLGMPMPLGHFWTPNYLTNFPMSNCAPNPHTCYKNLSYPTVNFGDFSEWRKTSVISSNTWRNPGFRKILYIKVCRLCVILILLRWSHRYKPSGVTRFPFHAPSHRERADVARVALWASRTCALWHSPIVLSLNHV